MAERAALEEQEARCQTVADYAALAEQALADPADRAYAEELAQKADGLCVEVEDTVAMAGFLHLLGKDAGEIRALLEGAEIDCQFTRQFVALARGFHEYCGDDDKMRELMEQAEEFCMTDEEQIDLGDGIHSLLGDAERAAECYRKGLAGVQDKDTMLQLAEKFAGPIGDAELARTVYTRAEEKMSTGADLRKLAHSVREHLKDNEMVEAIYRRATDSVTASHELVGLASDCLEAGLPELAGQVYDRVLETVPDSRKALELLAPLQEAGGDAERLGRVLERARELASESAELLDIAQQAQQAGAAASLVRDALAGAEERVKSLGELNNVNEAVRELVADDAEWHARLDQKLEKRKANQARYNEFQDQEKKAGRPFELVRLADRVMDEIEDTFYARKLLSDAESMLAGSAPDTHMSTMLARAVDRHLDETPWVRTLLSDCASNTRDFATIRQLAHTACTELSDPVQGREWAREWYRDWQQKTSAAGWDLLRLGRAVLEHLEDAEWAASLADEAAAGEAQALLVAQAGLLARDAGQAARGAELFAESLRSDPQAGNAIAVAQLLRDAQVADETVRDLYRSACPADPAGRIEWVEGILEVFRDQPWAASAYGELDLEVADPQLRVRLASSRNSRLERSLMR